MFSVRILSFLTATLTDRCLPKGHFKQRNTHLLNSIVHPFVTYEFMQMAKQAQTDGKSVVIYDAPQLFESGADVFCDLIVSVTAKRK